MHLERVIGSKHARIHAKPDDIAVRVANLKVRPTGNVTSVNVPVNMV